MEEKHWSALAHIQVQPHLGDLGAGLPGGRHGTFRSGSPLPRADTAGRPFHRQANLGFCC